MGSYCVYKHTSPSGKVYIGITRQAPESRWKNGIGYKSSPHFWSAIQKHGWENINHEIIYCGLSKEEACQKEKELIEKYNSIDRERGYNEKTGGETGVEFNESVKRKISAASRKRYEDPREREKASERARGFKHTDEAKAKMSAAKMGKHFLMTEEWKENISAANKIAYRRGTDAREKASKQCVENGLSKREPIEQCDSEWNVIRRFESMKAAWRETGIRDGNISKCCRGKALTAGGYKWRFATES